VESLHDAFPYDFNEGGRTSVRDRNEPITIQLEFVMETVNLSIQGMHCGGCAAKVSTALKSVPGTNVEEVTVGSARVSFDPQKTSTAGLISAVNKVGFKATAA
jgi:copper chaperone CopZ